MSRLVFDIESNGLLLDATKIWLICTQDLDTQDERVFGPDDDPIEDGVKFLQNAKLLIGHNIADFDLQLIKKLYPWFTWKSIVDTMILSISLNKKRERGHSLQAWGETLGYKKVEHEEWDVYSPEMRTRCVEDVRLNYKVYARLMVDYAHLSPQRKEKFKKMMRCEQAGALWFGEASRTGWDFDWRKADRLLYRYDKEMTELRNEINPKMGVQAQPVKWSTRPQWKNGKRTIGKGLARQTSVKKNGEYGFHLCRWLSLEPEDAFKKHPPVKGPFTLVHYKQLDIGSPDDQKVYAERLGWKPGPNDEWNYKEVVKSGRKSKVKTSPKIAEGTLKTLGDPGIKIARYNSLQTSHSVINTWRHKNLRDYKVHPGAFYLGADTFRCRHQNIVNVKNSKTELGKEQRSLFYTGGNDDLLLVGADSCSNQIRGLAHLIGDPEFIYQVVNQDIHNYNRDILDNILKGHPEWSDENDEERRNRAKSLVYAVCFGAGGGKTSLILLKRENTSLGNQIKRQFFESIPGLLELDQKLQARAAKYRYIIGLDGRKIYLDSPHKALVYMLQNLEKISMAATIYELTKRLNKNNIHYSPKHFNHDELQFFIKKGDKEIVEEITLEAFREGPKMFDIEIFSGEVKFGNSWAETH